MTTNTAWAARYVPTAVTMPWLSGVPTRCTHAAHPAPSTNPTTAPRSSHTASAESSRLSAAQRPAIENGTANTSATSAAGADGVPVPAHHGRADGGSAPARARSERRGQAELARVEDAVRVERRLDGGEHVEAPARAPRPTKRARLSPTPWWCDRLPPWASTARWPASHSATYVDSISSARRRGGEREVEAGAVAGSCARGGSWRRGRGGRRAAPPRTASNRSGSRDHGAAISIVSTTKPLRVSACSADVSLRWSSQPSTSSAAGRAPTAVAARRRRPPSWRRRSPGRPRRARAGCSACRRRRGRGPTRRASYSRSTAGVAPRRRTGRQASMPSANEANVHAAAPLGGRQRVGAQPHAGDRRRACPRSRGTAG